ncbi:MAG TPA: hypothetical protein VMB25_06205 [Bryobacteraceae bacterium]|nr:hypothetical protein [Bryobacteraceae bacterium]
MRTFLNQLPDGSTLRMADTGAQTVQWQLTYASLTDAEAASLQALFDASLGRLNTFTFLDPTDNLLMWSEDWTQPVWTADPMLQVTLGIQDPFGGTNALQLTNTGQADQRIVQVTGGPSWYQYAYSVYLRSGAYCPAQLVISADGLDSLTEVSVPATWTRVVASACLSIQSDGISFGVQLPPGGTVEACGAQVEAQSAPGPYKKTIDLGGVYSETRFNADLLPWTTTAPDQNKCQISLISNLT